MKRRQRGRRPCGKPRNHPLWTPTLSVEREGNTADAVVAWHRGSTGVAEAGHAIEGPPGTWETPSSPSWIQPVGEPERPKPLARHGSVLADRGSKGRGTGGTAGRGNEPTGTDDGESERPIVPTKPGNRPEGTRWREGVAGTRSRQGERCREIQLRERLNETVSDSGSGEEDAGDGVHDLGPPHRLGVAVRGVPSHAEGRSGRSRRSDGGGVRGGPGEQS